MRFAFVSAVKDLRRLRADPIALLVWLGVPLLMALLLSLAFGRGRTAPSGRLLITDEDQSLAGVLITGALSQGELGRMIKVEKVTREEGERRIHKGDGSALLVIPKGFGLAALNDQPAVLRLVTNPSQRIMPEIIRETLAILADAGFYVQRLAGDQIRVASKGQPTLATITEVSAAFNRLGNTVGAFFDPVRIELETRVIEQAAPVSFGTAMLPGLLFMAVMFVAGGLSGDLWVERARGTLRRVAVAPGPIAAFLAGKMMAIAAVMFAVALVALVSGRLLLDMAGRNLPLAVVWVTLSGAALFLLMTLLHLLASTQRAAQLLANLVLLPLTMIGGGFFPFEQMPAAMARIGKLTPNGWALVQLRSIIDGTATAASLGVATGGVAIGGAVLFLLCARRLRRGFLV